MDKIDESDIVRAITKNIKKKLNFVPEIQIGSIQGLYYEKNEETGHFKISKLMSIGLMISSYAVIVPECFFVETLITETIKFVPLINEFKMMVFRIKLMKKDSEKIKNNEWRLVFLDCEAGEFMFQMSFKVETYFKIEEKRKDYPSVLFLCGIFEIEDEENRSKVTEEYQNIILDKTSYMISLNKDEIMFISRNKIKNGFIHYDNQICAVFTGNTNEETDKVYKNFFKAKKQEEKMNKNDTSNLTFYRAKIIPQEESDFISQSLNQFKYILIQNNCYIFDSNKFSKFYDYFCQKERIENLLIGNFNSIDRVCKMNNIDQILIDKDMLFRGLLSFRNEEITKLELQSTYINPKIIKLILDSFYFSKRLTYIDLTSIPLTKDNCSDLCEFLIYNKSLQSLILTNTSLTLEGLEMICDGASESESLELLNISCNNLKNLENPDHHESYCLAIKFIGNMIVNVGKRDNLGLHFKFISYGNFFTSDDTYYFCERLKENTNFQFLNFSDTIFLPISCYSFASFLENNSQLEHLILSNCEINDSCLEKLIDGLASCINLKKLDLSSNLISFESLRNFSSFFLKSLKSVNVQEKYKRMEMNKGSERGLDHEASIDDSKASIKNAHVLKYKFVEEFTLILDYNFIEFEGLNDIARGLSSDSPIMNISLIETRFKIQEKNDHCRIFDSLFVNSIPIQSLNLQKNSLNDKDIEEMFSNLNRSQFIRNINICKNPVDFKGIVKVIEKLTWNLGNLKIYVDVVPISIQRMEVLKEETSIRQNLKDNKSNVSKVTKNSKNKESHSDIQKRYQDIVRRIAGFIVLIEKKKKKKRNKKKDKNNQESMVSNSHYS